jgi:hypothetical protein
MADYDPNRPEMSRLTARQNRAITALLTCSTILEAAVQVGVSDRTITRWLSIPAFRDELRKREDEALVGITRRLVGLADEAVKTIQDVLKGGLTPPGIRLRAAESVLANLLKLRDQITLEERISRLEEALDGEYFDNQNGGKP